jgi:histidine ammonia-lyase
MVLAKKAYKPLVLKPGEALCLINGLSYTTALAVECVLRA